MKGPGVVITSAGVVSACGLGMKEHFEAFKKGEANISTLTQVDKESLPCKIGFEVKLDLKQHLDRKVLRYQDRPTHFGVLALAQCLKESGIQDTANVGLVVGSLLGGVRSQAKLNKEMIQHGPKFITPFSFPNALINAPTFQTGMTHQLHNLYYCISTGLCAGADAFGFSLFYLKSHPEEILITGGLEDINPHNYVGFLKSDLLLTSNQAEDFCPFDRRRKGSLLGEGAALFTLETKDRAAAKNARTLAEIIGYSSVCHLGSNSKEDILEGMKRAMRFGLDSAGLTPSDIDVVFASANGQLLQDSIEAQAIIDVFDSHAKDGLLVSAPKSMFGECLGLSAPLQILAAICAFNENFIPPTVHYKEEDPAFHLNIVTKPVDKPVKNVMINTFSCHSHQSVIILKGNKA